MPLGRSRNNKRTTNASYASTITTIVFVALCVLGVWMLNSNSVITPQATERTTTSDGAAGVDVNNNNDDDRSLSNTQATIKSSDGKDVSTFEDNPGELPDDAIKTDDSSGNDSNKNSQDNQITENAESRNDEKQEGGHDGKDNAKGDEDSSTGKEAGLGSQGNESAEEIQKQNSNENQKEEAEQSVSEDQGNEQQQQSNNEDTTITSRDHESKNDSPDQNNAAASGENTEDQQQEQKQANQDDGQGDSQDTQTQAEDQQTEPEAQQDQSKEDSGGTNEENTSGSQGIMSSSEYQTSHQENELQEDPRQAISAEEQEKRIQEQKQQRAEDQQKPEAQQQEQQQQPTTEATSSDQEAHDELVTQETNNDTQQSDNAKAEKTNDNKETSFSRGGNSGIPQESKESKKSWKTQAFQSENQNERRQDGSEAGENQYGYTWQLCNVTAGTDYIPCLDNEKALTQLHTTKHFEHRERHCPEEGPTCLVPTPEGYKRSIEWPKSRDKIWYHNVPHTKLAEVKGHQNWVKVTGEFLTFPGGGTQFIHGALHYIDFLQKSEPNIKWGKHTRVILDVGCGVASFGGYLFERDVLTMSFAPKDEHEAQVQFALERGIPAISAVMGSQRLPFPGRVFDLVHCARCRVPWHAEGGRLLLELNRVLRPGGFFVWSATPVYQKLEEDVDIWKEMSTLTANMCWEVVTIQRDMLNSVGAAIYRKPRKNDCYEQRKHQNPPMCKQDDDPNAAWYVPLQACMHRLPVNEFERGIQWPVVWPRRMRLPPNWLNNSQVGIYGKPAPKDFTADYDHWKRVVSTSYMSGLGISWTGVRNVMDMRAVYGGFAAVLKDLQMWVMNVVNINSPDTLPIIYDRGLFGIYHDWCESFSTYPRTYDLLHADHLFSKIKKRCKLAPVMAEVDRIVRPGGKIIVRDESSSIGEVENLLKSLHWEIRLTFSKDQKGILSAQKGDWRPTTSSATS